MLIAKNHNVIDINDDPRATDRGYLLGEGVFETLRVYQGHIEHAEAHLTRLKQGAYALGLEWPTYNIQQLCHDVLTTNQLLTGEAALRITLSQSTHKRGLIATNSSPQLLITAYPYTRPHPSTTIKAIITPHYVNERSSLSRFKTTHYLEHIQAKRDATAKGFDEALLLNTRDRVCCSSIGNVFIYKDQQLITPPLSDGALAGITRQQLLAQSDNTPPIVARSISPQELHEADSIFHTNSLIGIQGFSSIHHRALASLPKPLLDALNSRIQDAHSP